MRQPFLADSNPSARTPLVVPMLLFVAALIALALSALPVLMFAQNLRRYLPACTDPERLRAASATPVSVLVPARNEESSIGPALDSILASQHGALQVIVMDDASEDATASIVNGFAQRDPRVQLAHSKGLPDGWNGKQNACWQLSQLASYDRLLFLDADVRLSPDAITRMVAEQDMRKAPLISGFPFQETGTIGEKLLIPLMHYVLLGYLPIDQMRASPQPGFAAGCGQLFMAIREPYMQLGGHSAIASSRHDGIKLPKAFRKAGLMTDLFDATDIARCRMYHTLPQVVRGLLKNATEGIANPVLIGPFTVLLFGGAVLPLVLAMVAWWWGAGPWTWGVILIAVVLAWWPRVWAALRFRQSWLGVLLHPLSVACFLALQWTALVMRGLRIQTRWRGRL
jgi:hypothetical protein